MSFSQESLGVPICGISNNSYLPQEFGEVTRREGMSSEGIHRCPRCQCDVNKKESR